MNDKEQVVFVTISMAGGGTEKVITTLANYWSSKGNSVSIFMIGGDEIAYELSENIEIKQLSSATKGSALARIARIRTLRKEFKIRRNATIIAMGTVASMFTAFALIGLGNRLILSERNDPNRLNHRPIKKYERIIRNILYLRGNRIVFQTDMARDAFPRSIKSRSVIIMNPISENLPAATDYADREKIVMTAGRLTEQKNHRLLIDAFIDFQKEHNDYILKIFGSGDKEEELIRYISDNKAESIIKLCGFSDKILDEMNRAQIYVSSSDWEGVSNSLMEAMAMGMTVIATDCPMGGSKELIRNEENGILVGVGRKPELIQALSSVTDMDLAKKYADNAKDVRNDYSVSTIVHEWEKLL
ncbi:MAG: glycosyltransferase [Lachnospiraceae bacterium]|nr:glycosyltransferase [Lachnospiraceae bacterium]